MLIGSPFLHSKMKGEFKPHSIKMTSLHRPKESKNDGDRPLAAHPKPDLSDHDRSTHSTQNTQPTTAFRPPTEVREEAYSFSIYIDLPGVSAQSINVTSCTMSVTIQGQRRSPCADSRTGSKVVSSDRMLGSFERVIQLSQPILAEQVYAEYSHGVLKLEIPKQLCSEDPKKMPITCRSMTL